MTTVLENQKERRLGLDIPFVREMAEITQNMWKFGWDERNGGNVSYILDEAEVVKYMDIHHIIRTIKPAFPVNELAGKYFIVTGSGKYFKNWVFFVYPTMVSSWSSCGVSKMRRFLPANCLPTS